MRESEHPALGAATWKERNSAVKALENSAGENDAAVLVRVIRDRRPASWWRRLLGEPMLQVGFIRRNAWKGLEGKRVPAEDAEALVRDGLADSYYEVRAQVYPTLRAWCSGNGFRVGPELAGTLLKAVKAENDYEVIVSALEALPSMIDDTQARELFVLLHDHWNWRVREAVVDFLRLSLRLGRLQPDEVRGMLGEMVLLSESFRPVFSVREKLAALYGELGGGK